jgi:Spy/CpxP family protein refolding chaperone
MKRHKVMLSMLLAFCAAAMAHAQSTTPAPQEQLRRLQEVLGQVGGGRGAAPAYRGALGIYGSNLQSGVRWWTNTALVARLGLTDEQKTRIERAFENHRENLASNTELLNKEEAQLGRFLEAESIDRGAVLSQIDRVIQARGEVERVNAAMTLEMREVLTSAQWKQLQPAAGVIRFSPNPAPPGGAGARGQRSGGQRQ